MKKIFKYSLIVALCAGMAAFTGCQEKEFDVNPLSEGFTFSGMAPNPVMRGGELRIFGRRLDEVKEVRFAGDISVTEFVKVGKGAKLDTLYLIVPLEGPEAGKVSIVSKGGEVKTSVSELSFSEPIEIESFSPATALSGDVITIKGEYLNDVREIFFSGDDAFVTEFESQERHELKVKVPANAISGPIILSDVNEVEDGTTIPNHIYTATDLTVGNPTVNKAEKATYKSGDVITVTGAHLDMIKNVAVPQVSSVEFTVAEDAKSLSFNLPPKATDGNITLTSFAGVEFDAGEIETVSVAELTVVTKAEDGRFKAGCTVEITGTDLDLVSAVAFEGAQAEWYLEKDKIVATQPAKAKDGPVTVTLESGKQAYSNAIEVVKPVASAISATEAIAGADTLTVSGTDLDLVTAVVIGNKEESFIECAFSFNPEDSTIAVAIPEQAYTGPLTLSAASGYETTTDKVNVSYDLSVEIKFDTPSYGLGSNITLTGKNLMQIEKIYIKGKKVTNYAVRTDTALSFAIPEGLGPGVYRLVMTLIDESEVTWPIPFSVTAPFTEKFIWEGNSTVTWSGGAVTDLSWGGYDWSTVAEGTILCAHFTVDDPSGCIRFGNGSWASIPSLAGLAADGNLPLEEGMTEYRVELTAEDLDVLVNQGGLVVCGTGFTITGLSFIIFGAAENKNVIWEGSVYVNWQNPAPEGAEGSMGALSWGGYDWSTVEAGTTLVLEFERVEEEVQIRVANGGWAALPGTEDPYKPEGTELRIELTSGMLAELVSAGGLVLTGQGYRITSVALATAGPAVPTGTTIWEGSVYVNWQNPAPEGAEGSMGALSWGGYDWSTVEAGTTLVLEFERVEEEVQIRVANGGWAALPGTEDPYKPEGNTLEVELTSEMLAELNSAGGLVLTGQGYRITAVILK